MIEELLCLRAGLWFAAQPNPFRNCAVNQILFRGRFENLIERCIGGGLVDFFQPEIALQSLPADGPLLHAQRSEAMRELGIVEVAIFAQTLDHCFDDGFRCAATFQQTLA